MNTLSRILTEHPIILFIIGAVLVLVAITFIFMIVDRYYRCNRQSRSGRRKNVNMYAIELKA